MKKTALYVLMFLAAGLFLSSCGNTFHGVGADMENMGQKIQDTF